MKKIFTCLTAMVGGLLALFILIVFIGTCAEANLDKGNPHSSEVATDNHYVSDKHIEAKNWFAGYLKKQMKDPDSYNEVRYKVTWINYNSSYEVDLTFRGNNSFGVPTIERWTGDVKFEGDRVLYDNVYQIELYEKDSISICSCSAACCLYF